MRGEWYALTVALLDEIAAMVRGRLGLDETALPLASAKEEPGQPGARPREERATDYRRSQRVMEHCFDVAFAESKDLAKVWI